MPEMGASKVMNAATIRPAQTPVNRARLGCWFTMRTTLISMNEITNSPTHAIATPYMPGTVATTLTLG